MTLQPPLELREQLLVVKDPSQFAGKRIRDSAQLFIEGLQSQHGGLRLRSGWHVPERSLHSHRQLPRRFVEQRCRDHNRVTRPRERTNQAAHVNRRTLSSENGDAKIGTQIQDSHGEASSGCDMFDSLLIRPGWQATIVGTEHLFEELSEPR